MIAATQYLYGLSNDAPFRSVARRATAPKERIVPMKITDAEKAAQLVSKTVDLDANPFVPKGWSVEDHRKGGMLDFDTAKIALYLSEGQKGDKRISGNQLREELKARPVYNANLLDWYLRKENQRLIPESWKKQYVFFWGTIYRSMDGNPCVRYLRWCGDGWGWGCRSLDFCWRSGSPAAVPAS